MHAWLSLVLVVCLYATGWLVVFDRAIDDVNARLLRHGVSSDVVIVDIDAKSLRRLDAWPWPRDYHAQLLNQLRQAAPASVVFDIDFSSKSTKADDAALARALSAWDADKIVLVAFLQFADARRDMVVANYPLREFRQHAELASINLFPATDGLVRTVSLRESDHPPGVLPLAAYLVDDKHVDDSMIIDYSIDPASFMHVSYVDVLEGNYPQDLLRGKKIIVGATAIELRDQLAVPVYRVLPGPVVQALAYESLRGSALRKPGAAVSVAVLLVLGAAVIVLIEKRDVALKLWMVAATMLLLFAVALVVRWQGNVQLDVAPYMALAMLTYAVRQSVRLDRQLLSYMKQKLLLLDRQKKIDLINAHSAEGLVTVSRSGTILAANQAACTLFAGTEPVLTGRMISEFIPALTLARSRPCLQGPDAAPDRFEAAGFRRGGERFYADISLRCLEAEQGDAASDVLVFIRDISPLKEQQALLDYQATHDPSTHLLNKTGFTLAIDSDMARLSAADPHVLMIMEIVSMAGVNHELGHAAGELFLKSVSGMLLDECSRSSGLRVAARIATDELAVWVECDEAGAHALANTVLHLFSVPVHVSGLQVKVEMNIGAAVYPEHADDAAELLRLASVAKSGLDGESGTYRMFSNALLAVAARRLTLASQLREAIAADGITVYYQPKKDMCSGQITSAEALVRWQHPELGFVPPDEFVRVAETSGVIRQLTEWVIRDVVRQHGVWQQQGIDLRIAVNISSKLLKGAELSEILEQALLKNADLSSMLTLEITESAVMDNRGEALDLLHCLAGMGYRLSLDDFGTGHSSFSYLKDLPVHELKIDKSFVLGMDENPKDARIVASIVALAHNLGLQVVAEGIETQAVLDLLAQLGCEYGQGYFIGKPMPASAITEMLSKTVGVIRIRASCAVTSARPGVWPR